MLAELAPAGSIRSFGPLTVAVTGVPGAFFNATWLLRPDDAADGPALSSAVDHLRATGLPFVVHVRSDLPQAGDLPVGLRLADEGVLPCFAIEPGPIPPPPSELEIRRAGPDDWDRFMQVTSAGFGMPRALIDRLFARAMFERPELRSYLGFVSHRAVATSVSIRTDRTLGIYNVATLPDARGRGYGTALTWELMRDADPGWDVAVLQASDMGRPVYERMGFALVREFIELVGRPEA